MAARSKSAKKDKALQNRKDAVKKHKEMKEESKQSSSNWVDFAKGNKSALKYNPKKDPTGKFNPANKHKLPHKEKAKTKE